MVYQAIMEWKIPNESQGSKPKMKIQLAKCGVPVQAPLVSAPYQLDPAFVSAAPAGLDGDGGW